LFYKKIAESILQDSISTEKIGLIEMTLNPASRAFVPSSQSALTNWAKGGNEDVDGTEIYGDNEDYVDGAIYGDAPDENEEIIKIGGIDMMVGGYGEYAIHKTIIEEKYNPGTLIEGFADRSYVTESILITRILNKKPHQIDPFYIALTKLSETIDNINKLCSKQISYKDQSFWKQINRCPCKVISFITLSKKDVDELINEIDVHVLHKFVHTIVIYTSIYDEIATGSSANKQTIPPPPVVELSTDAVELNYEDVKEQLVEMNNRALQNIKIIERYRDLISVVLDNSANLLNKAFDIKY
jgi:hypothetical protein